MYKNLLKKYNIVSYKSIKSWDEGMALGNGILGGLIYGEGPIKIAVDRCDLWDNRIAPFMNNKDFT